MSIISPSSLWPGINQRKPRYWRDERTVSRGLYVMYDLVCYPKIHLISMKCTSWQRRAWACKYSHGVHTRVNSIAIHILEWDVAFALPASDTAEWAWGVIIQISSWCVISWGSLHMILPSFQRTFWWISWQIRDHCSWQVWRCHYKVVYRYIAVFCRICERIFDSLTGCHALWLSVSTWYAYIIPKYLGSTNA